MFLELKSSTVEDLKTPSILPYFQLKFCKSAIFYIMSTDRGAPVKHDVTLQKSDDGEFPILCETCLGDNPYVRMIRIPYGRGCKSCGRPFTNFRWKAGSEGRYKSTQVCQMCAKTKNVCQCCVLDLTYGLPVQVRDTFLAQQQVLTVPKEDVNRAVYMQEMEKKVIVSFNY